MTLLAEHATPRRVQLQGGGQVTVLCVPSCDAMAHFEDAMTRADDLVYEVEVALATKAKDDVCRPLLAEALRSYCATECSSSVCVAIDLCVMTITQLHNAFLCIHAASAFTRRKCGGNYPRALRRLLHSLCDILLADCLVWSAGSIEMLQSSCCQARRTQGSGPKEFWRKGVFIWVRMNDDESLSFPASSW